MKRNRPLNQEKREAIIDASIEEFYTKGYEASSMDIISKEANVSKATVYNHFKNKEELFLVITDILKNRLIQSFSYTYSANKPIELQLKEIANQEMSFLSDEDNIKLTKIITVAIIQRNEIGLKVIKTLQDNCMLITTRWFLDAKNNKMLDFDDEGFVAQQFIGMLKIFAFYPQLYGAPVLSKQDKEKTINEAVNMILKLYAI